MEFQTQAYVPKILIVYCKPLVNFISLHCSEADCAIIELDSKPPLNWEVCYAMARRVEDRFYQQLENLDIESELERQTPFGPIPIHGPAARQVPYPRPGFVNSGSIVGMKLG